MTENTLVKLFEHNNWANLQIIEACAALSDEQLDAAPESATRGNIRHTLQHLVAAQDRYWTLLAGLEPRTNWQTPPDFAELEQAANVTGEGLLALAKDEGSKLQTTLLSQIAT